MRRISRVGSTPELPDPSEVERFNDTSRSKRLFFDLPRGARIAGGAAAGLGLTATGVAVAAHPTSSGAPPTKAANNDHAIVRSAESMGIQTALPPWLKLPDPGGEASPLYSVRAATSAAVTTEQIASKRDIKRAEKILMRAGFHPGKADGDATANTALALAQFQQAVGLDPTGELDRRTMQELAKVESRLERLSGSLGPGQAGPHVLEAQRFLNHLGYVCPTDGIFGPETGRATVAFERDQPELKGRTPMLTKKARAVLRREVQATAHPAYHTRARLTKRQQSANAATLRATTKPDRNGVKGLGLGATNKSAVANVQRYLRDAGFDPKRADGVYDDRTEGMVKAFQESVGLTPTGRVDRDTWIQLQEARMPATGAYTPKQDLNERSHDVLITEEHLRDDGYHPGPVDGIYTPKTESAADEARHDFKMAKADGVGAVLGRMLHPKSKMRRQWDHYAKVVLAHGGAVNPGGQPTVLGIRHVGGASTRYGDRFIVLTANHKVRMFTGSTHPGQSSSSLSPDVNGDGVGDVGMLRPGSYRVVANGPHKGKPSYHVVSRTTGSDAIPGFRDTNHDGRYSGAEKSASKRRGDRVSEILFHVGLWGSPSSIGCQNLPPDQIDRFVSAVGGPGASFSFTLIDG